ncbi:2Fe-2S iron-sulfur cluster-binding protein [Scytonema sp. PCC 10023]|uniref:2Fe-2S iron-sulfur cluster-binding protein n=1 Tax=Scytonema sp. PCC 10023 TaxID=1680591 RepID=UPI0039C656F0
MGSSPWQMMSAVKLLLEGHAKTDAEICEQMSGNICRCHAYANILAAVRGVCDNDQNSKASVFWRGTVCGTGRCCQSYPLNTLTTVDKIASQARKLRYLGHDTYRCFPACSKDAASVNSTRWALFSKLKETALSVETGTGGRTKYNRTRLGLPKTHWLDAACVGVIETLQVVTTQPLLIAAKGWGNRQMCTTNKYGFPIKHRTRCKTFFGFQTRDMVRAILPAGKFAGTHIGRLTVRESGVFARENAKR